MIKKIRNGLIGLVITVTMVFCDITYSVEATDATAQETIVDENVEVTSRTSEEKVRDGIEKINNGEELLEEEIEAIDNLYKELTIELPQDSVEWEVDHEKGIGCSDVMTAASSNTYYYGSIRTTVKDVSELSTLTTEQFNIETSNTSSSYNFYSLARTSFVMPGMEQTSVKGVACTEMIPQGILYYDGYIFITAYCGGETHNSVIYVLNASSKSYITTLVLADKYHSGGITYANGYIWISNTSGGVGYLCYYSYSAIEEAINYASGNSAVTSVAIADNDSIQLASGYKGSFITTYDGYLCVGEFNDSEYNESEGAYDDSVHGRISFYNTQTLLLGDLTSYKNITVPANAQGITFYEANSKVYLIINTSYGRNNPSFIHVYTTPSSVGSMVLTRTKRIEMPCMVEGSTIYGSYTYFVFESCGDKYRSDNDTPDFVLGKVYGFTNSFIFQ